MFYFKCNNGVNSMLNMTKLVKRCIKMTLIKLKTME